LLPRYAAAACDAYAASAVLSPFFFACHKARCGNACHIASGIAAVGAVVATLSRCCRSADVCHACRLAPPRGACRRVAAGLIRAVPCLPPPPWTRYVVPLFLLADASSSIATHRRYLIASACRTTPAFIDARLCATPLRLITPHEAELPSVIFARSHRYCHEAVFVVWFRGCSPAKPLPQA